MHPPAITPIGPVQVISAGSQPKKVWKHFHDPAEHWERLAGQDLTRFRAAADEVVGVRRYDQPELPALSGEAKRRAHSILCRHHDDHYGPIYLAELSSSDTRWTKTMDRQHRQHALTPRSVYVSVELDDPSRVITAFRPRPPTNGIVWEEADFRRRGLQLLSREGTMNRDDLKRLTLETLRRTVQQAPTSVREAWWIASAVGFGRVLADDPEVYALLADGEVVLRTLAPHLRAELAQALDWAGTRQRLTSGIEDERSEDFEEALADAEDLLAVADALGEDDVANNLCTYAASLLARRPSAWTHVADRANQLFGYAGDRARPITQLWAAIASAPDENPLSSRWRSRLARWLTSGSEDLQRWVRQSMASVVVAAPAPALGTATSAPWHIRGVPAVGAHHYRIFVVDEAHPAGYDVTVHFTANDGLLWNLDHQDDRALLVVFAGNEAITGRSLDEVLANAEQRSDVHVGIQDVSPPMR